jgi:hypothetical protein
MIHPPRDAPEPRSRLADDPVHDLALKIAGFQHRLRGWYHRTVPPDKAAARPTVVRSRAQAKLEALTLVTRDQGIRRYDVSTAWL